MVMQARIKTSKAVQLYGNKSVREKAKSPIKQAKFWNKDSKITRSNMRKMAGMWY